MKHGFRPRRTPDPAAAAAVYARLAAAQVERLHSVFRHAPAGSGALLVSEELFAQMRRESPAPPPPGSAARVALSGVPVLVARWLPTTRYVGRRDRRRRRWLRMKAGRLAAIAAEAAEEVRSGR